MDDSHEQLDFAERIGGLLFKYLNRTISSDELTTMYNWVYSSKENEEIFEHVVYSEEFQDSINYVQQIDVDAAYRSIQDKLGIKKTNVVELPVKRRGRLITVAASIAMLITLSVGLYFRMHAKRTIEPTEVAQSVKSDAIPGGDRAVLTLANGNTIALDNAQNGTLTEQGSTKITKLISGQLAYTVGTNPASVITYNTLATPRGGQYQLVLPDGTKVWLNNASSLHYPVAFIGHTREVELLGEAYFEVAHISNKPFRVKTKNCTIEDIGTHFNVMAYADEESVKTTLVQGSVKIEHFGAGGDKGVVLVPGQQFQVGDGLKVINDVDVDKAIAWKNGYFNFDRADLKEVMRQLSRWYDVDVQYAGGNITTHHFDGRIQRDLVLSKVLNGLENKEIHFLIDGRRIIITAGL